MAEKKVNKARIIMKHDTEENWLKATNFIPLDGEIIVYDADATNTVPRIKVGDGVTNVNALPFSGGSSITDAEIDEICGAAIYAGEEVEL